MIERLIKHQGVDNKVYEYLKNQHEIHAGFYFISPKVSQKVSIFYTS